MKHITYSDLLRKNMNTTLTENKAVSNSTTDSNVLDFFSLGGGLRGKDEDQITNLFSSAYAENNLLALRAMFYFRDIREGQGQRDPFRTQLKYLAKTDPGAVAKNLPHIPWYGRWDDVYALFGSDVEPEAISMIGMQMELDMNALGKGLPVSLMAKWLKSENTSSKESRKLGYKTRVGLGMDAKTYRQTLSMLRKAIGIVEQNLSAKDYGSINYGSLPSQAMLKYRNVFASKDRERYAQYLTDVSEGRAKINADTLYPQQIVHAIWHQKIEINIANALWNNMPDFVNGAEENSIAVVDVSGSMYGTPMEVSVGLGLYLAERAKGPYANKFITFSSTPQLVEVKGSNIIEKVNGIANADWGMSTNIEAVMDQILDTAINNDLNQEDMLDKLYIISDMEFDHATRTDSWVDSLPSHDKVLFREIGQRFIQVGYVMPQIVFWNVDSRNHQYPMSMDDRGFLNVSGYSPSIFKNLVNNTIVSPYEFMVEILNSERYKVLKI